jgi:hypothetical protein
MPTLDFASEEVPLLDSRLGFAAKALVRQLGVSFDVAADGHRGWVVQT